MQEREKGPQYFNFIGVVGLAVLMNSFVLVKLFHRGIWTEIKGKCSSFIFVGDYFTLQTLLISVGANMCTFLPDIDNRLYLVRKIEIRKRNFSLDLEKWIFSFLFLLSVFESGKTNVGANMCTFLPWQKKVYYKLQGRLCILYVSFHCKHNISLRQLFILHCLLNVFQILDSKNLPQKNMFTFDNLKASTSAQRTLQRALTKFGHV